jgi:hypothetical protein
VLVAEVVVEALEELHLSLPKLSASQKRVLVEARRKLARG